MKKNTFVWVVTVLFAVPSILMSCSKSSSNNDVNPEDTCTSDQVLDTSRGECSQTLSFQPTVTITLTGNSRVFKCNSIPNHKVGLFGQVQGAINPNAITEQNKVYAVTTVPSVASSLTPLLGATGPEYEFGILLNGVSLDPIAAEPFPHKGITDPNVNWDWNLEALNVKIGLDCNNAHVQPTGKYHYHGKPTLYLDNAGIPTDKMTLIGYAADGFPVYYKYAYSTADDNTSAVVAMSSSYQLKSGKRPGDGETAPCGDYNGVYSADYEYIAGLGTLDEANGRTGVTPEYPSGTYYYVLTDEFPSVPRYFRGTPSTDFKLRP